jgi:hypothetical protein
MSDYDRWKTTPPEPDTYCTCDYCGDSIYNGEDYIKCGNDKVHEDCFEDYAWEELGAGFETADKQADYEDYLADKADAENDERWLRGER